MKQARVAKSTASTNANPQPIVDAQAARESNERRKGRPAEPTTQDRMQMHKWQCGRYGLRWNPRVDLLDVPNVSGVYVLFFEDDQVLVGSAPNIFRRLVQCWYAPGRSIIAFSWMEILPFEGKDFALRTLQQRSYAQLWADIRPPDAIALDEAS